ncbi:DUF4390 domain-containing protein [Rivibacter subsaxonicus]|uniref:Uncharacterized protein DUF4390 n=1 Tax=Rivibacter subsaxonicus TaxID=457575 RepID=A0A4Q7VVY6_9BURK|nr:DUF4390 domain-containing protein [Rivibacter subsaxonicus]RZU00598.1 uncharacterized protein DUF4390 [Rivibacter subsaxonicus]
MGAGARVVGSQAGSRQAQQARGGVLSRLLGSLAVALLLLLASAHVARAETPELLSFELKRAEEGLLLSYAMRFELSRSVEDALARGVPIYFVAEAEVFRKRWYWRDQRIGSASRTWRLAWQPLTRRYRLSLGSLSQSHDRLDDALAVIQRTSGWKIAEPGALDDGGRQYVEYRFRLDTDQLPRPLQIGLGNQAEWGLSLEHTVAVPAAEN